MPEPGYDDINGGLPSDLFEADPSLAALAYPWDEPGAPDPAAGSAPAPAPAVELGGAPEQPPPFDAALAGAPGYPAYEPEVPAPEVDLTPPPPPGPPRVADLPGLAIHTEQPGELQPPPPGDLHLPFGIDVPRQLTPDQEREQAYRAKAQQYAANPGELLDRLINGGPLDADTQRYLNEFAQRDQPGFMELNKRLGDAKLLREANERHRIEEEDNKRRMDNIAMQHKALADAQAKSAAIDGEATQIANTKIGYHPTTFQRIAGVIAAVVGGLYQGRTGSARNPGMDALNDVINRDLDEQRTNLVNRRDVLGLRRSALAEQYARTGDMYQANEVARLAALKHADEQLATAQQNFAPDGTRGIQIAAMRAGIGAQIAADRRTREQKDFDNSVKWQTASREQQQADEVARNNRAQLGLGYARIDEERAQREETRAQRKADREDARADKLVDTRDKQVLERAIGGESTPVRDAQGNITGSTTGYITKADGSIWIPNGTEAQISDLQKQHAAATSLVQTLDAIRRIGPEWMLDTANKDKLQRLKQLMGDARLQAIAAKNLGVPTGHDIELAENFIGTSDPTRWKDSVAGLMQGRDSLVRDHNAMLRTHGLDKKWDPLDTSQPVEPKETVEDRELKMVLDDPDKVARSNFDPSGAPRPARGDWDAFPEQKPRFKGDTSTPDYRGHGILLQKQQLDEWAARARDPNAPGHDNAVRHIADVAGRDPAASGASGSAIGGAATAEVRDYARALQSQLITAGINDTPSAGGGR